MGVGNWRKGLLHEIKASVDRFDDIADRNTSGNIHDIRFKY